jgi:hypothetical protein
MGHRSWGQRIIATARARRLRLIPANADVSQSTSSRKSSCIPKPQRAVYTYQEPHPYRPTIAQRWAPHLWCSPWAVWLNNISRDCEETTRYRTPCKRLVGAEGDTCHALVSEPELLEGATADYAVSWNSLAFKAPEIVLFWPTLLVHKLERMITSQDSSPGSCDPHVGE